MLNPLEPEFLDRIGRMRPIDADMERGLCICLSARQAAHGNPAETAEPIDMPFGRTSSCGPNKPRIARGGGRFVAKCCSDIANFTYPGGRPPEVI